MKSFRESVFGSRAWAFVKEQNVPHMFPFMLYLIGYMLVFRYLETAPRIGYVDVSSNLDSLIPFCEIFIVPYISWFLFQAIWVVLVFIIDRKTYDQLTTMLMVGMTVFLVVSILVPEPASVFYSEKQYFCKMVPAPLESRYADKCLAEYPCFQYNGSHDDIVYFGKRHPEKEERTDSGCVLVRDDHPVHDVPEAAFNRRCSLGACAERNLIYSYLSGGHVFPLRRVGQKMG